MKNSKGETLKQPYLALAEMRRAQQIGSSFLKTWEHEFKTTQTIDYAFEWHLTTENNDWWTKVYEGQLPAMYHESLAELEAWQKREGVYDAVGITSIPTEPDYKAMYEELKNDYKILNSQYQIATMLQKSEPTPTRNWIAECAMRELASGNLGINDSWARAEAWAAEGRKRGFLPKNDNA